MIVQVTKYNLSRYFSSFKIKSYYYIIISLLSPKIQYVCLYPECYINFINNVLKVLMWATVTIVSPPLYLNGQQFSFDRPPIEVWIPPSELV